MFLNRSETLKMKRYPEFIIIGAGKCGTSSLNNYLNQHNQIYMCPQKETYFFISEPVLRDPAERAFSSYQMFVKAGHEKRDFSEILALEIKYIKRGFYYY